MSTPVTQVAGAGLKSELIKGRAAAILFSYYPSDPRPWRAALALASSGMTVEVLCLQDNSSTPCKETLHGIKVFRMPLQKRRSGYIRYLFEYTAFLLTAVIFLTYRSIRYGYDLIHVHNMPDFLVFTALVPRLLGTKVILDMHDPMPELYESIAGHKHRRWLDGLLKKIEKFSLKFADLVLTPNAAFRELFASRSCDPGKLHIIMNSPDEEIFRPNEISIRSVPGGNTHPFKLMYHGSFVVRNGLDIAIEAVALARLHIPNVTLEIYGKRTEYLDASLAVAKQKGLDNCIFYLGSKSRVGIAQAIASSDLGLVSNRQSTFTELNMPTRIFEFLAIGKPVIAPNTRGIRDYFGLDELLFFEPGKPEDLARVIQWCFYHREEVNRVMEKGRQIYQQHLWSSEKAYYLSLVKYLIADKHGILAVSHQP
jgi:glycosyltransferase involved in cell wall biosynthesis